MATVNLKDHPELRELVKKVFPSYRKHTVSIMTGVSFVDARSYWTGGSRSYYTRVEVATGRAQTLRAQFGKFDPDIHRHAIPAGYVVAKGGTFNGKPARLILMGGRSTFKSLGLSDV